MSKRGLGRHGYIGFVCVFHSNGLANNLESSLGIFRNAESVFGDYTYPRQ